MKKCRVHTGGPIEARDYTSKDDREVMHITATSSSPYRSAGVAEADSTALPERVRRSLVKRTRCVTYASLAVTIAGGCTGIAAAMSLDSASVLGYALESFVDVWSSILVLWRFWEDRRSCSADAMAGREKFASFGISVSFLVISYVVGKEAVGHIQHHRAPEEGGLLLCIAIASVLVLGTLCGLKYDLSRKLRSESLRKDAITSGAVAVLSAAMVVSTMMYALNPRLWWFDSLVALGISLALFAAGLWSLVSTQWWSPSFWRSTAAPDAAAYSPPGKAEHSMLSLA